MSTRTVRMQSMITPEEAEAIRELADRADRSVSDFVRLVLLEHMRYVDKWGGRSVHRR